MSGADAIALILVSIALQLKKLYEKLGLPVPPEGEPFPLPLPVTLVPELSEPLFDVQYESTTEQTYQKVFEYKVPDGYKVALSEIAIAPDNNAKTKALFLIKIGAAKVDGIRLLTSFDMDFQQIQLFKGAVISIHIKSTDGTTVACNASFNGRKIALT